METKNTAKMFSARIDAEVIKKLKHLSVDLDRSVAQLAEEAIKDLLKKYGQEKK